MSAIAVVSCPARRNCLFSEYSLAQSRFDEPVHRPTQTLKDDVDDSIHLCYTAYKLLHSEKDTSLNLEDDRAKCHCYVMSKIGDDGG